MQLSVNCCSLPPDPLSFAVSSRQLPVSLVAVKAHKGKSFVLKAFFSSKTVQIIIEWWPLESNCLDESIVSLAWSSFVVSFSAPGVLQLSILDDHCFCFHSFSADYLVMLLVRTVFPSVIVFHLMEGSALAT